MITLRRTYKKGKSLESWRYKLYSSLIKKDRKNILVVPNPVTGKTDCVTVQEVIDKLYPKLNQ